MANSRTSHLANLLQSCIDRKAHLPGKLIHGHILRHGLSNDTFLYNRLVELYGKCGSIEHASRMFDAMPQRNVFSWNAIISVHCKAGSLDFAHRLLSEMPERNAVSWNMVISASVRSGLEWEALDLYYMMIREGFMPTNFTLTSVLSASGSLMALEHGRRCHGLAIKVGLDGNLFVENALVGMYTKCGGMNEANALFDTMSKPNEVSFTALMGGLVQCGSIREALRVFAKMHRAGIHIDSVAISAVLGACARTDEGQLSAADENYRCNEISFAQVVHALLIKCGFESDIHVGNSLADVYVKYGQMEKAEAVFLTLPETNVASWNILIAGYGQTGDTRKAIDLLHKMKELGFEADDVTYIAEFSVHFKSGDLEAAHQILDKILDPSVTVWNTLLSAYCQNKAYKKATELFRKMQYFGVIPDTTTFAVILSSCSGIGLLDFGKQVHAASTRLMLHNDMFVASGLVDMYSKCRDIKAARSVFDRMLERDVVCWNSIISGFALHSMSKEAFTFFKDMRANDMYPTEYSYASVISSCARLTSLAQGREMHALVEKDGFASDIFVGSALIDMYAKCGSIEGARGFFDSMPVKNIVSWNEMIHGYAQNGCGIEAVELFKNMIGSEEKPDGVTFIAVLTACSHSGLVDEGLKIFYSMEEHPVKPSSDHYTCIIDALGRAGRFEEVEVLINRMECKDDPIVWEVLLSSCRVHANVSLGKLAAERLFHLDPQNSSPYVLLSNIYAALGRWSDAAAVRRLMNEQGVVKNRGYSWVDYRDGEIHAFMVDDDLRALDVHGKPSNDGFYNLAV